VLTSTDVAGIYPAGGHYRFDFDTTGKLVSERRFMNTCFDLDYRARKDGNRLEAMVLTHLLDPQPTEIHAFVSRNIPIPLLIITVSNEASWHVVQGHIEYARDVDQEK
jgi:hypothetical protein